MLSEQAQDQGLHRQLRYGLHGGGGRLGCHTVTCFTVALGLTQCITSTDDVCSGYGVIAQLIMVKLTSSKTVDY